MSAEIDMSNDRANIAYINEKPWHGLGEELTPNAPLEVWTKQAGMEWNAIKKALTYQSINDQALAVPNRSALIRDDTSDVLGIVATDNYNPVQPKQIIEFYRDLTEKFGFQMETAGCLFGGKRVWALANTKNATQLKGGDAVNLYLLLSTSYDCTGATTARLTSVRVVCNNTLSLAMQGGIRDYVSIHHSSKFDEKAVEQAKRQLQVGDAWDVYRKNIESMQNRQMSKGETTEFLANVYDIGTQTTELCRERFMARMQESLFNSPGAHMASARGTLWGVLNAVTWDVDHGGRNSPDHRMFNTMMGAGAARKAKAYNMAMALAA